MNADPGITGSIRTELGWGGPDDGDYILEEDQIHTITDNEIRLQGSF